MGNSPIGAKQVTKVNHEAISVLFNFHFQSIDQAGRDEQSRGRFFYRFDLGNSKMFFILEGYHTNTRYEKSKMCGENRFFFNRGKFSETYIRLLNVLYDKYWTDEDEDCEKFLRINKWVGARVRDLFRKYKIVSKQIEKYDLIQSWILESEKNNPKQ